MTTGRISRERRGHVALLGIDRAAKRNAFDIAMYEDLARAYGEADKDDDVRCVVLFAHGEHFTAGLDLAQFVGPFSQGGMPIPEGAIDPLGLVGPAIRKPVVCAVQGTCLTIGIELLLATDIRVAAQGTRFGQIEIKRGIYPVGGATIRMPRELGWGNAMRWLLTGDEIPAEEAFRIGMVQELTPLGGQIDRAIAIAETIAAQAPLGVRATLVSSRIAKDDEAEAARRLFPDLKPVMASEDAKEGVQSFLERRAARFTGR
jgi:enoyl-CoA hydratase/carnithine racemase